MVFVVVLNRIYAKWSPLNWIRKSKQLTSVLKHLLTAQIIFFQYFWCQCQCRSYHGNFCRQSQTLRSLSLLDRKRKTTFTGFHNEHYSVQLQTVSPLLLFGFDNLVFHLSGFECCVENYIVDWMVSKISTSSNWLCLEIMGFLGGLSYDSDFKPVLASTNRFGWLWKFHHALRCDQRVVLPFFLGNQLTKMTFWALKISPRSWMQQKGGFTTFPGKPVDKDDLLGFHQDAAFLRKMQ